MEIKCPLLAVDVIVRLSGNMDKIVLIRRKNFPLGWALPGGFVDYGERVEDAALREIEEEIGLKVEIVKLLGIYSDPDRDPRGHCVSITFIANGTGIPVGGDDAKEAKIFSVFDLPEDIAFDHKKIINDYAKKFIFLK